MTNRNENVDQVYCTKCFDYHDVTDVDYIKVEAEYQGHTTLFYVCPVHKEEVSSLIHVRGKNSFKGN